MEKVYNVSYNYNSTDDTDRWKVLDVESDREILVNGVLINSFSETSCLLHEEIGEYNSYVHFITCKGRLEIIDNVACITSEKEDNVVKRHVLKTITYRILATSTTILGAFYMGVGIEVSALLGAGEIFLKPILYFFHERAWYNSKYWNKK